MADLSADSIERVAARRQAESDLKKTLSGVGESDDVGAFLPAFTSFACALFDAEAGEFLAVCEDAGRFETALQDELAPRIIEGILPDRSLSRIRAGFELYTLRHTCLTRWAPHIDPWTLAYWPGTAI